MVGASNQWFAQSLSALAVRQVREVRAPTGFIRLDAPAPEGPELMTRRWPTTAPRRRCSHTRRRARRCPPIHRHADSPRLSGNLEVISVSRGFLPAGTPFGPLVLSPFQWQDLVLVPVIGVVAGFTGQRLYERLLRRRGSEKAG
jgi:hypothetical protein